MSGFGKWFYKNGEEGQKTKEKASENKGGTSAPKEIETINQPAVNLVADSPENINKEEYKKKYRENIEKAFDEANDTKQEFKGADFREFDKAVGSDKNNLTDKHRYENAFNILKSAVDKGLTKEHLLKTADEYVSLVLEPEKHKFNQAMAFKLENEVVKPKKTLETDAKSIQDIEDQIKQLEEKREELIENRSTKETNIRISELRLSVCQEAFDEVVDEVKKEYEEKKKLINDYIQ